MFKVCPVPTLNIMQMLAHTTNYQEVSIHSHLQKYTFTALEGLERVQNIAEVKVFPTRSLTSKNEDIYQIKYENKTIQER